MNFFHLNFKVYYYKEKDFNKTLPSDTGVYMLAIKHNKGLSIKYIGCTVDFKSRITVHAHLSRLKDDLKKGQHIWILFYCQNVFFRQIEHYLLSRLRPPYNLTHGGYYIYEDVSIMKHIMASKNGTDNYYEFLEENQIN